VDECTFGYGGRLVEVYCGEWKKPRYAGLFCFYIFESAKAEVLTTQEYRRQNTTRLIMAFFFFLFILLPLSAILVFTWFLTEKKIFGWMLMIFWIALIGLFVLGIIIGLITDKKKLKKKDYYGQYIIDRTYFAGKQADWQYNNFRFEIKDNDSVFFYVTNNDKILKTFKGTITTLKPYSSERLVINMQQPTHHIITTNPTTYRSSWSFYLVFNSPKFGNMFFKKGEWKPTEK
jgi:hypothetical protein